MLRNNWTLNTKGNHIPLGLAKQVQDAHNTAIDEIHESIDEMTRVGWELGDITSEPDQEDISDDITKLRKNKDRAMMASTTHPEDSDLAPCLTWDEPDRGSNYPIDYDSWPWEDTSNDTKPLSKYPRKNVSERDDIFILDEWEWDNEATLDDTTSEDSIEPVEDEAYTDMKDHTTNPRNTSKPSPIDSDTNEHQNMRWYAPCNTQGCPCTASYNGQDNQSCCKACRTHQHCKRNHHYFPSKLPKEDDIRQPISRAKRLINISKESNRRIQHETDRRMRTTPTSYRSSFSGTRGHPRT